MITNSGRKGSPCEGSIAPPDAIAPMTPDIEGDEDCGAAVAGEEPIGPVEVAPRDQEVAAPALDERTAAVLAHGISRRRAEIAADRPGGSDEKEVHLPDGNQISGEGHDDLGRK